MRFLPSCVTLLLVGCASVGTNFDVATVQALKPGMTEAQVIQTLGAPNSRTRMPDGSEMFGWTYGHAAAFGSASGKAATLKFDAGGRYIGIMSTTETRTDLR
jgi:hypothetical protein